MMKQVNWGMIGCGRVTEVKSGPAFNRVRDSRLLAVAGRTPEKAREYARRHGISRCYDDIDELINDPDIDAVYVASPPDTHARYGIQAARAGKHVYVEKPMARNYRECVEMVEAADRSGVKLFVAYYRRRLSYFLKVREILRQNALGEIRMVHLKLWQPLPAEKPDPEHLPWRFVPEISGGGLFVDLGSHQLDLLDFLLGPISLVKSVVSNRAGWYPAEDTVNASFRFEGGIPGCGSWCFAAPRSSISDLIAILGSKGSLEFSTFEFTPIRQVQGGTVRRFQRARPGHIQQPMIASVVDDLLERGTCPSTGVSAARTSRVMDEILLDYYSE
jgi:1,5-anhydro-D-fructose reductase (1,5-anhydro-D-mannitol-forming)